MSNGTDGELCLSGPLLMRGYYKNSEATAQALKRHSDGKIWLHTGDIFCKNDEGYLFFRQRLARMIVCSGYNVYLSQIEHTLAKCDIVEKSCAVGIGDKVLGSKVGLFVILRSQMDHQEARNIIMNFCKLHMAEFSLPHRIEFIEEFPKTRMGKVDFIQLEQRMQTHKQEVQHA